MIQIKVHQTFADSRYRQTCRSRCKSKAKKLTACQNVSIGGPPDIQPAGTPQPSRKQYRLVWIKQANGFAAVKANVDTFALRLCQGISTIWKLWECFSGSGVSPEVFHPYNRTRRGVPVCWCKLHASRRKRGSEESLQRNLTSKLASRHTLSVENTTLEVRSFG